MKPEEAIPLLQRGLIGEIYDEKGYLTALGYEALDAIDSSKCPTLVQNQHGEWKPHDQHGLTKVWYERYKCSNCNEYGWLYWHFCQNCGADMRKKEGGENEREC